MCSVNGTPDTMQVASNMIGELIQNAINEGRSGAVRGRGQFNGQGQQRPGGFNNGRGGAGYKDETTFCVPSDKCGLVIGKGGDTIRELNRESNARIELSKIPTSNTRERMFRIEGNPQEIHHAIQLICDKAGIPCPDGNYSMQGGGGGDQYMQNGGGGGMQYGGQQPPQQQQQQQQPQQVGWGQPQQGQNMQQWNQQPANAQPGDPS